MPKTAIAFNIAKSGNALLYLSTQRTFDCVIPLEDRTEGTQFFVGQLVSFSILVQTRLEAEFPGHFRSNSVKVSQRDDSFFIVGYINTEQSRHLTVVSKKR